MHDFQREFITLALSCGALRFGSFTLKSGRVSPYFFNSGLFNSGASLARLGRYYAATIEQSGIAYDVLFGPAYKGIPLVAAVSIGLAEVYQRDMPYAFNRKEAKDHGEGGITVGAALHGGVLIVDDVITAGTSVAESVAIIEAAGAQPAGVVIALDRQERGKGATSAVQEAEQRYGIRALSIVNLHNLVEYLTESGAASNELAQVRAYREDFGV